MGFLHRATRRQEGLESLQLFGTMRMIYAMVWLVYRRTAEATHPTQRPHLMGFPNFVFTHPRTPAHIHAISSAMLLPFVAHQIFCQHGSSRHKLAGRLIAVLVVGATPANVGLLCSDRHAWWLTTLVQTLVLTQWGYHLWGLCVTRGIHHRWHGIQFCRMWLTPVDVRVATSLALLLATTDPALATVLGHSGALLLWMWRLAPRPPLHRSDWGAPRYKGPYRGCNTALKPGLVWYTPSGEGMGKPTGGTLFALLGGLVGAVALWFALLLSGGNGYQLLATTTRLGGSADEFDPVALLYIVPLAATILAFSSSFYDGEPLLRLALPLVVALSISPPTAVSGLTALAQDISNLL